MAAPVQNILDTTSPCVYLSGQLMQLMLKVAMQNYEENGSNPPIIATGFF
jgi:hypothetical protein